MIDCEAGCETLANRSVETNVVNLAPAVSVSTTMLGLAAAATREYSNAVNQQQLNQITAMQAVTQHFGARPGNRRGGVADSEAMALLRQALAAIQAN